MIVNRRVITRGLSLAGALTVLVGVAPALAATNVNLAAQSDSSRLTINDATNDADAITVSESGGTITITDTGTGGIATADPDCALVNATTVTCPLDPVDPAPPAPPTAPVRTLQLDLNNGTDSFTNQNLVVAVSESDGGATGNKTVSSGPGDDFTINTGTGDDIVDLGAGDNEVETNAGNDIVTGGPGEDDVDTGTGNDVVNTGAGRDDIDEEDSANDGADLLDGGAGPADEIDYDGNNGVTIKINGQPDDGHPGEGDNLLGFEELNGTGGADVIAGSDAGDNIGAGDGNDAISAGGGDDLISQGDGDDSVDGGEGGDVVFAGSEADGADVLAGGGGLGDEVDYCCGIDPVTINQNGQADDGRAGEGDNLSGFEGFDGGNGPDSITGDASPNQIIGNGGDDLLVGLGGDDEFRAGGGDDTVNALGGRDDVRCDLGFDTIAADAEDLIGGGCERHGAEIASESARVDANGKAKLLISCGAEEGAPCVGKIALLSNEKQIAKGTYRVTQGEDKNVTAKLSKKGRKVLAASNGKLLISAEARTQEPPGVTTNAKPIMLTR
jgi:hypothetical protein